ncbi:PREDICTED: lipase 3-like [Nicrophorus vespilloides]|uniref:Lipase n=1 Tax=Nicrophorus vespilloides TaxID=110193 RepID=A0ABM1MDV5_NICVS|nr:PREDICTED: lipase 3-like [Nicrophorus vespilloides]
MLFYTVALLLLVGAQGNTHELDIQNLIDLSSAEDSADPEDAHLLVPDLIEKYGYTVEVHNIITSDGYNLTLHRIPHGIDQTYSEGRPIAYVQHGLLCSSADWVVPGPEKGLAYILADAGYDVWMGNARGNRYSRKHNTLDPDDDAKEFWDFSWHEIAVIDVPEMIDFVLNKTGQSKLFHIGHSQGTTTFYIMCSERPEYNDKIIAHFSLAPIAYMKHMTSPLLKLISVAEGGIEFLLGLIGMHEFMPTDGFLHNISKPWCDESVLQPVCTNTLFVLCGFNKNQMNNTLLPIILGHTPAGAATKQLLHYAQEIKSGFFRQYDHGLIGNQKKYGSIFPPNYKLKKVVAPVYLFYSRNDWLSAEVDVNRLYTELGNSQAKMLVADPKWNHLDYMWGIDAPHLVYNKVISLMEQLLL